MSELAALVKAGSGRSANDADAIAGAAACLHRFTAAFNACDAQGMDAELHFPHTMLSASEQHVWNTAGQHPPSLFNTLKGQGWSFTQYESIDPVLVSADKVHFVVAYSRRKADGTVLTEHRNLWVVVQRLSKWGIVWRSY